jgi:transcriptional regulator with XRE-family HTH domain
MDILARLQQLMDERGWSMYRLAKECHLPESTIINSYRRQTQPSIATLDALCKGLGISISQFFAESDMVALTSEQKELFSLWINLNPEQKDAVLTVMRAFSQPET